LPPARHDGIIAAMTRIVSSCVLGCWLVLMIVIGAPAQQLEDPDAEYVGVADNLVVISERLRVTERYIAIAAQKVNDARTAMIELLYGGEGSAIARVWMEVIASASDDLSFCQQDLAQVVRPALHREAMRVESPVYQKALIDQEQPIDQMVEDLHRGKTLIHATTLRLFQFIDADNITGVLEQLNQLKTICFALDRSREQLHLTSRELRSLSANLREIGLGH